MKKDVIIMGSRGYTKNYGGWETLVHGMVDNWVETETRFFVIEVTDDENEKFHEVINNINIIRVVVKDNGPLKMLKAEAKTLDILPSLIEKFEMKSPILYVLGMRVGAYFLYKKSMFKKYNVAILYNSDGIGWKRDKYSLLQKIYSYLNSYIFCRYVLEYLVCDADEMKKVLYPQIKGRNILPKIKTIYYGTNEAPKLEDTMPENVREFFNKYGIKEDHYYIIINRFVPENSYELIIKQFMASDTNNDFVIVSNIDQEHVYYEKLKNKLKFEKDKRIKFVGSVYDKVLLAWLRQKARGYINGHTLGGTNPGLLEALATTNINLIRDCAFSREGAADTGFYFDEKNTLAELVEKIDNMSYEDRERIGNAAKERMRTKFSWTYVNSQYVELFNEIVRERSNQ